MNQKDIIAKMCEKTEMSYADCNKAYKAFVEAVKESLSAGETVTLVKFATLHIKHMPERKARNPKTQEMVVVPARDRVCFRPGSDLKRVVQK